MKIKIFPIPELKKIASYNKYKENHHKKQLQRNIINVDNVNYALEKQFHKFELLRFNLFGENFDNYGDVILHGITYKAKKIKINYKKKNSKTNFSTLFDNDQNNMTKKKYHLIKSNSFKNELKEKFKKIIKTATLKSKNDSLPKLNNIFKVSDANMKNFLEMDQFQPKTFKNMHNFIQTRNEFLKRHDEAETISQKINKIRSKSTKVKDEINNVNSLDEDKKLQFKYRYIYVRSKFL